MEKPKEEEKAIEKLQVPELSKETEASKFELDVKYECYVMRTLGGIQIEKKKKRVIINGLTKTMATDDFTIQENSNVMVVTLSFKKELLNIKKFLAVFNLLYATLNSKKSFK